MAKYYRGSGKDMGGQRIGNLADGVSAADAVTLNQLQAVLRGLKWKNSVKVATTTNITLSNTQTIDGVAVVAGDRVLVKDQSTASANGVYVVAASAWARAGDFDDTVEITSAAAIPVEQGTANGDSVWILTTDGAITIGTTSLSFTRLGGTGTTYTAAASGGLDLTGSAFSVKKKAGGGLASDADGLYLDAANYSGFGKVFEIDVPSGSTSPVITHGLGRRWVCAHVYEISSGAEIDCDPVATSTTQMTLTFGTAPTAGQYRFVACG